MAVSTGIEPAIFCVTGRRVNHCTTKPWLRKRDSNPRPSGYEPDELPTAPSRDISIKNGGGSRIRTHAPLARPPGFQDRSLQPTWVFLHLFLQYRLYTFLVFIVNIILNNKKWCLRPDLNRHEL